MLNDYLELMVDALFENEGTLDKFVGDRIIGLFGAPAPIEHAAYKAVHCALEMRSRLSGLNQARTETGLPAIAMNAAICTGRAYVGSIGSSRAMQYTAIGEPMNVGGTIGWYR